jgi:hypothetical protein
VIATCQRPLAQKILNQGRPFRPSGKAPHRWAVESQLTGTVPSRLGATGCPIVDKALARMGCDAYAASPRDR